MHAFVNLDRFDHRSEGSFRNWLASIVENRIRDQWRRSTALKRGAGRARPFGAYGSSVLSESILVGKNTTPSQEAMGLETEERLEAALLALDERSRRAIELRRLCGMSYAELASEMGLGSESSARAMVARALARLSQLL